MNERNNIFIIFKASKILIFMKTIQSILTTYVIRIQHKESNTSLIIQSTKY